MGFETDEWLITRTQFVIKREWVSNVFLTIFEYFFGGQ